MFHRRTRFNTCFAATASASLVLMLSASAAEIDFNTQIRPLLSDRCFKCHGPDEGSREAKLRLDTEEGSRAWINKAASIRAVTPGAREKSEVWQRITSSDRDELMPPSESNLKLAPKEIELIGQWIEQGAKYGKHWAFRSVEKPKVPKPQSGWARNPIDRFVETHLLQADLRPAPEAAKETLIRRLSFDLTGLPPTVEDIRAFRSDTSDNSYEKLVDRLLASPAYGERMANEWLDLARYADTYGYQSDVGRDMYPWRDWVIRAFNSNMRYDQFITWQLAGDLLPDATDEQILATAFNRLHRQTNEGGSIEEEFRAEYVADRVHTFSTAFLGLTMECARCHDHKYDPITQKNYYELSAFFNNIDESGLYSHFTQATPSPTLLLYSAQEKNKHAQLKTEISNLERALQQISKRADKDFTEWARTNAQAIAPAPIVHFSFDEVSDWKTLASESKAEGILIEKPSQISGYSGKALQFNGENSVNFKNLADWRRVDPFSFSFWIKPGDQQSRAVVMHHSRSWTDSGSRGYELVLHDGKPRFALVHFWPGNAIAIEANSVLPTNQWTHLTLTYDGSSRAAGMALYVNGERADATVVRDHLVKDIVHRSEWGDAEVGNIPLVLAARFRDSGFKNGAIDELSIFDSCLTAAEVATLADPTKTHSREELFSYYLRRVHNEYVTTVSALLKARATENQFVNDIREIMVMKELETRRPTYLLKRGAYDAPGEAVFPGTPTDIFPFNKNLPSNRLGLAKWTIERRNPLTSRVVVNRVWKQHFGRGLVATPEDFGSQGKSPTHPELLDWLAFDFMDHGWDLKRLHKLIVTSATYRQSSSSPNPADPDNLVLSRGPKHRFTAEQIRDAALKNSGLLVEKLGGPSVKPYQPAGLWEQSGLSKTYVQGTGDDLYRRSLYTFWRRTSPPPSMTTFDATTREVCTAKRETTATPLQALVLMNDPQFVEAARVLAERLVRKHSNLSTQLKEAFETVLGRTPSPREREVAQHLVDEQRSLFSEDPSAAEKLLSIGTKPRNSELSTLEVAAWTILVSTLMNHEEFVTKR